jgi:hypothetical protein
VRRHAIGVIALVLLLGAGGLWIWPLDTTWYRTVWAACCRLGPTLAVLWLAYPDVKRLPNWIWYMIPLLLLLIAWRRVVFVYAFPILVALVVLALISRR